MTAGRMTLALCALTLGIAAMGMGPALAASGGTAGGISSSATRPNGMPAGGAPVGAVRAGARQPGGAGCAPGTTVSSAGCSGMAKASRQTMHPIMHRTTRAMAARRHAGASAQNPEVARLNEGSLKAARNGTPFNPSSMK